MEKGSTLKILSSCYGRIEKLFLAIPKDKRGGTVKEGIVPERYQRLFKAFGDRVQFVVLGDFEAGEEFEASSQGLRAAFAQSRFIEAHHVCMLDAFMVEDRQRQQGGKVEEEDCHNAWVQDPFAVLGNGGRSSVLLEPMETIHKGNAVLAEQISAETNHLIKSSRILFEGGNILAGDDYVLIGENTRQANLRYFLGEDFWEGLDSDEKSNRLRLAKEELDQKIRDTFGVKFVIWVGLEEPLFLKNLDLKKENEEWQPLFHLDLYLNLGGLSHVQDHQGDELIFVGELRQDHKGNYMDVEGEIGPGIKSDLDKLHQALNATATFFEAFQKKQDGPRFEVLRVPLAISLAEKPFVYSWNNCLVEYYQGIRRVYLPFYNNSPKHKNGDPSCNCAQCAVPKIYRPRDFRVAWVDGAFDLFVRNRGSLHCLTKVLERKSF